MLCFVFWWHNTSDGVKAVDTHTTKAITTTTWGMYNCTCKTHSITYSVQHILVSKGNGTVNIYLTDSLVIETRRKYYHNMKIVCVVLFLLFRDFSNVFIHTTHVISKNIVCIIDWVSLWPSVIQHTHIL